MTPAHTSAQLFESAMLHLNSGDRPAATKQLEKSLLLDPTNVLAWNNRGLALLQQGHPFDCILHMDRAISLKEEPEYYSNRGAAWLELGEHEKALADYDRALAIKQFEHAHNNRGNVLLLLDRHDEARSAFREAIRHNPDYVDAHLNLAFLDLAAGNFVDGWKGYEWRWRSSQLVQRGLPVQQWGGEAPKGPDDALLLYGEQGMGDMIQFCRYAKMARQRWHGKIYVEVRQPLQRLVSSLDGIDGVISYGDPLPDNLTRCLPLMSMPLLFGTTVETIPNEMPYLGVASQRVANWRKKISELPGGHGQKFMAGICWAGMSRTHQPAAAAIDARRSTQISDWAPLARVPGVTWVSLQKGAPTEQVMKPPLGMTIVDWTDDLDDFCDTAALISSLDLVVTVDTAVAHVAAALGKPTWIFSRHDGCWRWMGKRPDSPWYPSVRLFHQPAPGNWQTTMNEAAAELRKIVHANIVRVA